MIRSQGARTALLAAALSIAGLSGVTAQDAPAPHDHGAAATSSAVVAENPFLAENAIAMDKMMADMHGTPTGDIDRDFVEMMIPHHQGAIDMAKAYLRYGTDEQLRRICQEIIVEQVFEIAAMRTAVGDPLPASAPVPTQVGAENSDHASVTN